MSTLESEKVVTQSAWNAIIEAFIAGTVEDAVVRKCHGCTRPWRETVRVIFSGDIRLRLTVLCPDKLVYAGRLGPIQEVSAYQHEQC